jgi:hypothetical protein
MTGPIFTQTIQGCARCRSWGHENLEWKPFEHDFTVFFRNRQTGELEEYLATHWSMCPMLGEPIFMANRVTPTTRREAA